jgi:predicted PurR-regulated permease PerM
VPPQPYAFNASASRSLCILAVIACGAAAWATRDFLLPTAAAGVLALALTPLVRILEQTGIASVAAASIVMIAAALGLTGTSVIIAPSVLDLVNRAPEIAETIEERARPLKLWLGSLQLASDKLDAVTSIDPDGIRSPATREAGGTVLQFAPQMLAQTLYVLVLASFFISTRETFRVRLIRMASTHAMRVRVSLILNDALAQVANYLFTMSLINAGVALTVTVVFTLLGVPYAVAWGSVFGLACFIPYAGPTVTIILFTLTQLVMVPDLTTALLPPFALLAINFAEANIITPWLVSSRIEVSSLVVFLTVALFAWLSGPFAAIVAVPVLIVFTSIARHVPALDPFAILLTAESSTARDAMSGTLSQKRQLPTYLAWMWNRITHRAF